MCTQPLKIINPKLKGEHCAFNAKYDPLMLRVPCGKCQECQNMKQQEWLTRLAAEYEYTNSIGGFTYKDMFTYNEWNVPRFHGLLCFNKEHYTAFVKKLRTYLERHYQKKVAKKEGRLPLDIEVHSRYNQDIMAYNDQPTDLYADECPKGKLKIFWVSEFGGTTGRPHYHGIFFVQFKISPWVFAFFVHKAWIHGFCSSKPVQENVVNGISGISYAAKYLCKDIEFAKVLTTQKSSTFTNYMESQWQKLYGEPFDKEHFLKYPCESIKGILKDLGMQEAIPYSRYSRYIGIHALQALSQQDIEEGCMKKLDPKRNGQVYKVVSIPMYLKRKLYYDYNKEVKAWELNDTGKLLKILQEKKKIHKTILKLEETFNQPTDIETGMTELGTEISNGNTIQRPIDKTVCYKIYNDIKRNKNHYMLLINLLNYRDNMVTEQIIKDIENGKSYMDFYKEALINEWDSARVYKEHKPHTHYIELYKRSQIQTWETLITQATKDIRYITLLNAYDKIQTTRLLNKERYLIREHEAYVATKNQPKRFKAT